MLLPPCKEAAPENKTLGFKEKEESKGLKGGGKASLERPEAMSETNTETQTIYGWLKGVVWENREAFEANQPPKSFLCSVTAWGTAGGGP